MHEALSLSPTPKLTSKGLPLGDGLKAFFLFRTDPQSGLANGLVGRTQNRHQERRALAGGLETSQSQASL